MVYVGVSLYSIIVLVMPPNDCKSELKKEHMHSRTYFKTRKKWPVTCSHDLCTFFHFSCIHFYIFIYMWLFFYDCPKSIFWKFQKMFFCQYFLEKVIVFLKLGHRVAFMVLYTIFSSREHVTCKYSTTLAFTFLHITGSFLK